MDQNNLQVLFTSIPGRYALALFNNGVDAGSLEEIYDNFVVLDAFLNESGPVKKLLTGSALNNKELADEWAFVCEQLGFTKVFSNFVIELAGNKRFNLLGRIKHIFNIAFFKYFKRRVCKVSSAVELSEDEKKLVVETIHNIFNETPDVFFRINKDLVGGIKISSRELSIDVSIQAQLKQLSSHLKGSKVAG